MPVRLRLITALCLVGLFAGCASQPTNTLGDLPRAPAASIEQMLQQAAQAGPEEAAALRLAAADKAMSDKDYRRANSILQEPPNQGLKPALAIFANTLRAELALVDADFKAALALLDAPEMARLDELPVQQQVRTHMARARALEGDQQILAAARQRTFIAPLLSGEHATANHEKIWTLIASLPREETTQSTGDVDLDGWLALANAIQNVGTVAQQQSAIENWRMTHPQHPAALQLPESLQKLQQLANEPLKKIALLLPQQGQLATVSRALRDGFLASRFTEASTGSAAPEVVFYDSSRIGSLDEFYRQAQTDGVQLVVGPLEKPLVRQLGERKQLPITTLALNYSDSASGVPPQLFQFGLAAEDEAREAARRAWADGKRNAVAMVPMGEWGDRVLAAFQQEWQAQGGILSGSQRIGQPVELSRQIASLLQVSGNSRRQDVDFMFLAATPQQARQIKPTLSYQYAADLPVYATSNLYTGIAAQGQDSDLDGIYFCDTPWLLNPDDPLRQQITRQWPQAAGSMGRLYAMGADAYRLAPRLAQLEAIPETRLEGLSGTLGLTPDHRIERTLPWAQFRNGLAQPVDGLLPSP
ncbi:penicillin-binding protein activator [Pseudomonas matsuisoli]|uniref:Penicillin-binding protein activator n=1 Tax=Pseudomonas matsuisoli TaxID=1515666 RepID=A0A917V0M0_9PSED|nr:penicillin-binding protein activator [Pseudomonas matsuisoli]GGK07784.1 penicillin-binding protein activator [Pseudomonas matsuisoli]